ncbi:hypothetical protein [Bartonella sp. MM55XZML]|uniref:hypothetical protein n=1 Tax=Bartonella sp. MM55XZML TaxID=3243552 RepID=UPI0035D03200
MVVARDMFLKGLAFCCVVGMVLGFAYEDAGRPVITLGGVLAGGGAFLHCWSCPFVLLLWEQTVELYRGACFSRLWCFAPLL